MGCLAEENSYAYLTEGDQLKSELSQGFGAFGISWNF